MVAVGAEADDEKLELLFSNLKGKDLGEVLALGRERFASSGGGGGGGGKAATTASTRKRVQSKRPSHLAEKGRPWIRPSTSGGPATLHASLLETTAAGPSTRIRPMVKGGGGGKAGDHGVDEREGAEQATLSSCGKRTATDKAGNDGSETRIARILLRGLRKHTQGL